MHHYGITNIQKNGKFDVVTIDTTKATYFGIPWHTLGDFGKRKLENIIFLKQSEKQLIFKYV